MAWIWTDFGIILTQFWLHFGLFLGSFWAHFRPPFGGPFRAKRQGNPPFFHCSGAPGRLSFGAPFGLKFGSISASFRIPFCSLVFRPEPEENIVKENNKSVLFFQLPSPKAQKRIIWPYYVLDHYFLIIPGHALEKNTILFNAVLQTLLTSRNDDFLKEMSKTGGQFFYRDFIVRPAASQGLASFFIQTLLAFGQASF